MSIRTTRGQRGALSSAAAGLLLVVVTTLLALAPATRAHALTLTKDGIESAEAAQCVIDIDNLQNVTFSTTNSNFQIKKTAGTFVTKDGSLTVPVFGVYLWDTPAAGIRSIPGSFDLVWKGGLLDNKGKRHDLHVRISNVKVNWRRDPGVGSVSQQILRINPNSLRLVAEPSHLVRWDSATSSYKGVYDPWETSTHNPVGVSCDVTFWNGDSDTLKYNLFARDIDQPDRFTGNAAAECSFGAEWAESFTPSSAFSTFHVHKSSWLKNDGSRIYGSRTDDDEEQNRTAFVSLGTLKGTGGSLKFTWKGSACSSRILEDYSYLLKTRVIDGIGGTIYTKTGSKATIKSTTKDTWNSTGTVPKSSYLVTATPQEGYHISGMWLDGKRVSAAEIAAGAVSVPNVSANHTVSVQFKKDDPTYGSLSLAKSPANPSLIEGNPSYTLEGARYGVYADGTCTESVAELVTHADGSCEAVQLLPGTYYVKEVAASQGYALDNEVHEAQVSTDAPCVLQLTEQPQYAPVNLLVQKVDAQSGQAVAQGAATLVGAEYTVCYYAGHYSDDDLPTSPTRTWVLRTDEAGTARLTDDTARSGDDPYLVEGSAVVPLGTLTVQETKAPEGYRLAEGQRQLWRVQSDGQQAELPRITAPTMQEPTTREQVIRGGIRLKKIDGDTGAALAGATFAVRNDNPGAVIVDGATIEQGEVCLTLTSGEDGVAVTDAQALPYGTYTIIEQKAPTGYARDGRWQRQVTIREDGALVDLTGEAVANRRKTVRVPLVAHKVFDGESQGRALEADQFSFVLKDADGTVLQTKANDAEGGVRFDDLVFDSSDLEKEQVFHLSEVEGDDQEIVYDTHVETVRITLAEADDGLTASVKTDEDGLVFHNHTVAALDVPLTGQGGVSGAPYAALVSFVSLGLLGFRMVRRRRLA